MIFIGIGIDRAGAYDAVGVTGTVSGAIGWLHAWLRNECIDNVRVDDGTIDIRIVLTRSLDDLMRPVADDPLTLACALRGLADVLATHSDDGWD